MLIIKQLETPIEVDGIQYAFYVKGNKGIYGNTEKAVIRAYYIGQTNREVGGIAALLQEKVDQKVKNKELMLLVSDEKFSNTESLYYVNRFADNTGVIRLWFGGLNLLNAVIKTNHEMQYYLNRYYGFVDATSFDYMLRTTLERSQQMNEFDQMHAAIAVKDHDDLDGKTVYHGTNTECAASILMNGPQGEAFCVSFDRNSAEEQANALNQPSKQNRILEGKLQFDQEHSVRVAKITIANENEALAVDIKQGIFPHDWNNDSCLKQYMLNHFDMIRVLGSRRAGYSMDDDYLVIHESAGNQFICWDKSLHTQEVQVAINHILDNVVSRCYPSLGRKCKLELLTLLKESFHPDYVKELYDASLSVANGSFEAELEEAMEGLSFRYKAFNARMQNNQFRYFSLCLKLAKAVASKTAAANLQEPPARDGTIQDLSLFPHSEQYHYPTIYFWIIDAAFEEYVIRQQGENLSENEFVLALQQAKDDFLNNRLHIDELFRNKMMASILTAIQIYGDTLVKQYFPQAYDYFQIDINAQKKPAKFMSKKVEPESRACLLEGQLSTDELWENLVNAKKNLKRFNCNGVPFLVDNYKTELALQCIIPAFFSSENCSDVVRTIAHLACMEMRAGNVSVNAIDCIKLSSDISAVIFFEANRNDIYVPSANTNELWLGIIHEWTHAILPLAKFDFMCDDKNIVIAKRMRRALCEDYWRFNRARAGYNSAEKTISDFIFKMPNGYSIVDRSAEQLAWAVTAMAENDEISRKIMPSLYREIEAYVMDYSQRSGHHATLSEANHFSESSSSSPTVSKMQEQVSTSRHNIAYQTFDFTEYKLTLISGEYPIKPSLLVHLKTNLSPIPDCVVPNAFCHTFLNLDLFNRENVNAVRKAFRELNTQYYKNQSAQDLIGVDLFEQEFQDFLYPQNYALLTVNLDSPWFNTIVDSCSMSRRAIIDAVVGQTQETVQPALREAYQAILSDVSIPLSFNGFYFSGYRTGGCNNEITTDHPLYLFFKENICASSVIKIQDEKSKKFTLAFSTATPWDILSTRTFLKLYQVQQRTDQNINTFLTKMQQNIYANTSKINNASNVNHPAQMKVPFTKPLQIAHQKSVSFSDIVGTKEPVFAYAKRNNPTVNESNHHRQSVAVHRAGSNSEANPSLSHTSSAHRWRKAPKHIKQRSLDPSIASDSNASHIPHHSQAPSGPTVPPIPQHPQAPSDPTVSPIPRHSQTPSGPTVPPAPRHSQGPSNPTVPRVYSAHHPVKAPGRYQGPIYFDPSVKAVARCVPLERWKLNIYTTALKTDLIQEALLGKKPVMLHNGGRSAPVNLSTLPGVNAVLFGVSWALTLPHEYAKTPKDRPIIERVGVAMYNSSLEVGSHVFSVLMLCKACPPAAPLIVLTDMVSSIDSQITESMIEHAVQEYKNIVEAKTTPQVPLELLEAGICIAEALKTPWLQKFLGLYRQGKTALSEPINRLKVTYADEMHRAQSSYIADMKDILQQFGYDPHQFVDGDDPLHPWTLDARVNQSMLAVCKRAGLHQELYDFLALETNSSETSQHSSSSSSRGFAMPKPPGMDSLIDKLLPKVERVGDEHYMTLQLSTNIRGGFNTKGGVIAITLWGTEELVKDYALSEAAELLVGCLPYVGIAIAVILTTIKVVRYFDQKRDIEKIKSHAKKSDKASKEVTKAHNNFVDELNGGKSPSLSNLENNIESSRNLINQASRRGTEDIRNHRKGSRSGLHHQQDRVKNAAEILVIENEWSYHRQAKDRMIHFESLPVSEQLEFCLNFSGKSLPPVEYYQLLFGVEILEHQAETLKNEGKSEEAWTLLTSLQEMTVSREIPLVKKITSSEKEANDNPNTHFYVNLKRHNLSRVLEWNKQVDILNDKSKSLTERFEAYSALKPLVGEGTQFNKYCLDRKETKKKGLLEVLPAYATPVFVELNTIFSAQNKAVGNQNVQQKCLADVECQRIIQTYRTNLHACLDQLQTSEASNSQFFMNTIKSIYSEEKKASEAIYEELVRLWGIDSEQVHHFQEQQATIALNTQQVLFQIKQRDFVKSIESQSIEQKRQAIIDFYPNDTTDIDLPESALQEYNDFKLLEKNTVAVVYLGKALYAEINRKYRLKQNIAAEISEYQGLHHEHIALLLAREEFPSPLSTESLAEKSLANDNEQISHFITFNRKVDAAFVAADQEQPIGDLYQDAQSFFEEHWEVGSNSTNSESKTLEQLQRDDGLNRLLRLKEVNDSVNELKLTSLIQMKSTLIQQYQADLSEGNGYNQALAILAAGYSEEALKLVEKFGAIDENDKHEFLKFVLRDLFEHCVEVAKELVGFSTLLYSEWASKQDNPVYQRRLYRLHVWNTLLMPVSVDNVLNIIPAYHFNNLANWQENFCQNIETMVPGIRSFMSNVFVPRVKQLALNASNPQEYFTRGNIGHSLRHLGAHLTLGNVVNSLGGMTTLLQQRVVSLPSHIWPIVRHPLTSSWNAAELLCLNRGATLLYWTRVLNLGVSAYAQAYQSPMADSLSYHLSQHLVPVGQAAQTMYGLYNAYIESSLLHVSSLLHLGGTPFWLYESLQGRGHMPLSSQYYRGKDLSGTLLKLAALTYLCTLPKSSKSQLLTYGILYSASIATIESVLRHTGTILHTYQEQALQAVIANGSYWLSQGDLSKATLHFLKNNGCMQGVAQGPYLETDSNTIKLLKYYRLLIRILNKFSDGGFEEVVAMTSLSNDKKINTTVQLPLAEYPDLLYYRFASLASLNLMRFWVEFEKTYPLFKDKLDHEKWKPFKKNMAHLFVNVISNLFKILSNILITKEHIFLIDFLKWMYSFQEVFRFNYTKLEKYQLEDFYIKTLLRIDSKTVDIANTIGEMLKVTESNRSDLFWYTLFHIVNTMIANARAERDTFTLSRNIESHLLDAMLVNISSHLKMGLTKIVWRYECPYLDAQAVSSLLNDTSILFELLALTVRGDASAIMREAVQYHCQHRELLSLLYATRVEILGVTPLCIDKLMADIFEASKPRSYNALVLRYVKSAAAKGCVKSQNILIHQDAAFLTSREWLVLGYIFTEQRKLHLAKICYDRVNFSDFTVSQRPGAVSTTEEGDYILFSKETLSNQKEQALEKYKASLKINPHDFVANRRHHCIMHRLPVVNEFSFFVERQRRGVSVNNSQSSGPNNAISP